MKTLLGLAPVAGWMLLVAPALLNTVLVLPAQRSAVQAGALGLPRLRAISLSVGVPSSSTRCGDLVEMEIRDVVPLKEADTHAVVLVSKDRSTVLPIFVDKDTAVSIAFRLAHHPLPRELTHDLLERVVAELGGNVTEVRIDDVQGELYSGRIFITQGNRRLTLDAHPADSIAMALTRGAKICVTPKVLKAAGITRQEIDELRQKLQNPGVGGSPQIHL